MTATPTSEQKKENSLDFDIILVQIGQFGLFQWINYSLMCLAAFSMGFFVLNYVFTTGRLDYRCEIELCEDVIAGDPGFLEYAVPYRKGVPEKCLKYALNKSAEPDVCVPERFDRSESLKCENVIFTEEGKTILNEWNLICRENEWKLALVGTVNSFGQFFCYSISGFISDRFGRRTALVLGLVMTAAIGTIKSFSVNYEMLLVFEFLEALNSSGIFASAFILGMEFVGPSYRVKGSVIVDVFYSIGQIVLGLTAMLLKDWRWILRVLYAPVLLSIVYIWIVPESVRWQLTKGRSEEAMKTIKKIAKINKKPLSAELLTKFQKYTETVRDEPIESSPLKKLLRNRTLFWRFIRCTLVWMGINFVVFGININSVMLPGDKYINFMMIAATEIVAHVITYNVLDRIGRRIYLCASLLICGVVCAVFGLIPLETSLWIKLVFVLVGKCAIVVSWTTIYIYTAELFPTSVRQRMLGLCCTIGSIGTMLAPQTTLLVNYVTVLPFLLFGAVSLIAGFLSLTFPETLNTRLPSSVDEAIEIDKRK